MPEIHFSMGDRRKQAEERIEQAFRNGQSQDEVRAVLVAEGWSDSDASRTALRIYETVFPDSRTERLHRERQASRRFSLLLLGTGALLFTGGALLTAVSWWGAHSNVSGAYLVMKGPIVGGLGVMVWGVWGLIRGPKAFEDP